MILFVFVLREGLKKVNSLGISLSIWVFFALVITIGPIRGIVSAVSKTLDLERRYGQLLERMQFLPTYEGIE